MIETTITRQFDFGDLVTLQMMVDAPGDKAPQMFRIEMARVDFSRCCGPCVSYYCRAITGWSGLQVGGPPALLNGMYWLSENELVKYPIPAKDDD